MSLVFTRGQVAAIPFQLAPESGASAKRNCTAACCGTCYYYVVPGFANMVLPYLSGRLDPTRVTLLLNTPIVALRNTADGVVATTASGVERTYQHVVVTASLGVLQNSLVGTPGTPGVISFSPSLPVATQNAIRNSGWGYFEVRGSVRWCAQCVSMLMRDSQKVIVTLPNDTFQRSLNYADVQDYRLRQDILGVSFLTQNLNATDAARTPVPAFVGFSGGASSSALLRTLNDTAVVSLSLSVSAAQSQSFSIV